MAQPLHVSVCALDGRSLEIPLDVQATGADLKAAVATPWNVPAVCQILSVGIVVVEDTQLLAELFEEGSLVLAVTLVKSLDEAIHHLASGCMQVRYAALDAVVKLLPRQVSELHADILSRALEDVDLSGETRAAAVKVLAKVAPGGNTRALETLTKAVADRSPQVRSAAIRGLRKMLPEGSAATVRALGLYARGRPVEVMHSALKAINVVAPGDDTGQSTVDVLELFLESPDKEVSTVATKILTNLAARHNGYAKDTLKRRSALLRSVAHEDRAFHGYPLPFHRTTNKGMLVYRPWSEIEAY